MVEGARPAGLLCVWGLLRGPYKDERPTRLEVGRIAITTRRRRAAPSLSPSTPVRHRGPRWSTRPTTRRRRLPVCRLFDPCNQRIAPTFLEEGRAHLFEAC